MYTSRGKCGVILGDVCAAADRPAWMCGNTTEAGELLLSTGAKPASKADLLLVKGMTFDELTAARTKVLATGEKRGTVVIIEIGYCGDYSMAQKIEEKGEQHKALKAQLEEDGWIVQYRKHVETVVLGHGGTVYVGAGTLLKGLGVSSRCVDRTVLRLARHSAEYAHATWVARNKLLHGKK